jgi:hypothetical protein
MDKHVVFEAWAPRDSAWSAWAKPVLFAHMQFNDLTQRLIDAPLADVSWAPGADKGTAIILDLPGPNGVWAGLGLAGLGYRPVPLYNACPGPSAPQWPAAFSPAAADPFNAPVNTPAPPSAYAQTASRAALVDVGPILTALFLSTPRLKESSLPADAPPAFLLDANRRVGSAYPRPGQFDNRSVSFPTDFPSANLLLSRGINRALLVQQSGTAPQADLAHTLRRWQEAGIRLELKLLSAAGPPVPLVVDRPSAFRSLWHRLLVSSGLRRNPLGGFGGVLPEPSAG